VWFWLVWWVAGLLLAFAGTKLLLRLMFTQAIVMPVDAAPSLQVIGFAFGVSLLTGLILASRLLGSARRSSPQMPCAVRNRSTHDGSSLLQRSLVVLQAALSVVLLIGAGLLGKSLNKLQHQDLGLETENRVIIDMNPMKAGYKPEQLQGLYQQIEDKFHAMPGVEHVGLTLYTPLNGDSWSFYAYVQGQSAPAPGKMQVLSSTGPVRTTSKRSGSGSFGDATLHPRILRQHRGRRGEPGIRQETLQAR